MKKVYDEIQLIKVGKIDADVTSSRCHYVYIDEEEAKEYIFTIESSEKAVDGLQVGVAFSRDDANPDIIARGFRREYSDYKSFNNLKF